MIEGSVYIEISNFSSEFNIVLTLIDNQTYTNVPGIIPIKVPKIYERIFILKKAGITLTAQNGIRGINLSDIRYNKSFCSNPFFNLFRKEEVFCLKKWFAIVLAATNTIIDPIVAEKTIIKKAFQPKSIPPKIVKVEAIGIEKETTII